MTTAASLQTAAVSAEVVIFTIRDERLSVLLVRRPHPPFGGGWSLPGGLVRAEETLEQAADRTLAELTGIEGVYLEQLFTFGRPERDPRGRVVAVAYYALMPFDCLRFSENLSNVAWHCLEALPPLALDHGEIVTLAQRRLSAKLDYSTIALEFMPDRFTLSQLQSVYECILGEPLDKRNFRKRLQSLDCLEETGETFRAGKHRPAMLYRVKRPGCVQIIK